MKNIKYILIYIFFFTSFSSYSQVPWIKLNSPTTQNLRKCFFLDSLNGWAVGDSGVIIHTSNKGLNWTVQNSNIKSFLTSVFFINERRGWALAWSLYTDTSFYGTIVLKTTNGGVNWDSSRYPVPDIYLKAIYFMDSLTGFMAGAPANIIKTTDGGNHWTECQLDSAVTSHFPVNDFCFYSRNFGFAYGGIMDMGGVLWRTTNGGNSWSTMIVASEPIYKMVFFDSLNFFGIGGDLEFGPSTIRTTNAGMSWNYRSLEIQGVANSLAFRTKNVVWSSLGGMMKLLYSVDTGKEWTVINSPDSSIINELIFTDSRNGFAIGDNGVLYKYNNGFIGINEQGIVNLPSNTILYQNYPNPFNPVTNINYYLSRESFVTLKIYDILGREVHSTNKVIEKEGNYSYIFNRGNLPSGIYFYRLFTESTSNNSNLNIQVRKMLLLK
jgi:photosystem II stability/assembly factor-like uncharacterized protein